MAGRRTRRKEQPVEGDGSIESGILQATEKLLADRPLEQISVADILRESGVSRSSFYFYFESKDAVAAALLRHISHEFRDAMSLWVAADPDAPAAALRDAVHETIEIWDQHRGVLRAAAEATPGASEVGTLWQSLLEAYTEVAAAHISAERAAGRAPGGPDPAMLAHILIRTNDRAFYLHVTNGRPDEESFIDALAHVWSTSVYSPDPALGSPRATAAGEQQAACG